jgi:hypothetical protein
MPKTIEINRGVETFDDHTDFSRGNKDRQRFGEKNADAFSLRDEYDAPRIVDDTSVPPPVVDAPPAPKFTHKLANGTVLEAATVEELSAAIEKSIQVQAPSAVEEFEDKPLYEGRTFTRKELPLTEQAALLNTWGQNPQAVVRKLIEAEFGATPEEVSKTITETQMALRLQKEMEAGVEFLGENEDFNPSKANGTKLTTYLREQNKPITVKNLGIAFRRLVAAGDKALLAKPEPVVEDPSLADSPPPPVHVPSNQGLPETVPNMDAQKRAAEFSRLSLREQQEYFAKLRRG